MEPLQDADDAIFLRVCESVWSAKSKKSHIFIVKLYFHCYAHINITIEQFSLLIRIIFTLLLYIFVAISYFHCKPIFLLHAHSSIANSYLYCKCIFLLQVHIFIASAYFHCFRIFLLQPHGNISHALQKISHVVQKISHGLAVCKTRKTEQR